MILAQYCLYFIIYSFFGWIYESLFYSVQLKKPVNTGFLRGCLCPIYGFACVFNILFLYSEENTTKVFLLSMLVISAIEYSVSYILEALFDKRWWDYSNWPCNINGRISLISSLGFGIMSVLQLRVLHPIVESGVELLSEKAVFAAIAIVAAVSFTDLMWTIKGMDKEDERLWFLEEESELVQRTNERIKSERGRLSDMKAYIKEKLTK